jgi:hypothetical protein
MDCTTTFDSARGVWYGAEGGGSAYVATIDAEAGTSKKVELQVNYVLASMSYDPSTSMIKAVGSSPSGSLDFIAVNATDGSVLPIARGIKQVAPQVCESAVSTSTGRFYTLSNDKENDDADQVILTYDLATGSLLNSAPWPAVSGKQGTLNSLILLPPGTAGGVNETLAAWCVDHNFNFAARLALVDPMTGKYTIIAQLPSKYNEVTIPPNTVALIPPPAAVDVGATAANATIVALAFDNGQDQPYIISADVSAAHMARLFEDDEEGEGEAGVEGAPAPRITPLNAGGTQLLWAPVWQSA